MKAISFFATLLVAQLCMANTQELICASYFDTYNDHGLEPYGDSKAGKRWILGANKELPKGFVYQLIKKLHLQYCHNPLGGLWLFV